MKRRTLLAAGVAASMFAPVRALSQPRMPRICMLSPRPLRESNYAPAIIARLAELGYRDGSTMHLDYRSADGHTERYATLALGLIGAKCDVMITLGTEPTVPFREALYPVPLVFLALDADPLERKLVKSLRSPGVNATGVYKPEIALVGKRVELARELFPSLRHIMVLSDNATRTQVAAVRSGAKQAGIQVTVVEFTAHPYDYESSFASARKAHIGALTTLS